MAYLILSDDEKAALTWFELDDATIGKAVKKTAFGLIDHSKELERVRLFSVALQLCSHAARTNSERMTVDVADVDGGEQQGHLFGDWRIRIEREVRDQDNATPNGVTGNDKA